MTDKKYSLVEAQTRENLALPATVDHNDTMIAELREDPEYAEIYLQTAFEEIYEEGGVGAFLIALRQVIEARGGVGEIARRSGINRQHVYRALSKDGNPTINTITELTRAAGVRLTAHQNTGV